MSNLEYNEEKGFYTLDLSDNKTKWNTVDKKCGVCGEFTLIKMTDKDYDDYYFNGYYVQDVWANLSRDLREVIITGTHPKCWDSLWGECEDDDNEYSNSPFIQVEE